MDHKSKYLLKNDEWKLDIIPEIMDGKNISDYIDPEILVILEQLEMEEEDFIEELKADGIDPDNDSESDLDEENIEYLDEIRQKKHELRVDHQIKGSSKPQLTRKTKGIDSKEMDRNIRRIGVEEEELENIKSEVRA
ncbi:nucleolar GTP-binding protein 1 [Tieghemostelium lacteum]|uniref:Nucleolar GTP-binding protein 1 n=1 Tax=Tieghemostelium lacteum TaxID=361077 RepID=A0A152A914_TIELA|nr:nucleolar GTP-binding protein 1 [Tieghemostelium lacteum]|eukprot:KYR02710.1 nucleolar GTP-binding protein 1 [Tieghemostelium lacteum]